MESDQATPEGIDEAISTLDGGVRNLAMDVALNQIEGWRLRLESSGSRSSGRSPTVRGGYRAAFTSGEVDAEAVGGILTDLGEGVRGVASTEVEQPVSGRLDALAGILSDEGCRISGS